jgi:nucleoside-diphosphate-sugar epimerase
LTRHAGHSKKLVLTGELFLHSMPLTMSSAMRVVVTGASGFLGKHVVLALMQAGHSVRASVRNPAMAEQVRHAVLPHVDGNASDRLEFVTLDLTRAGRKRWRVPRR